MESYPFGSCYQFPGYKLVSLGSKYPCVLPTSSLSTKSTTDLLEVEFEHFGFPHTIVTDNATTFTSGEFQEWCGIIHLTGAPYHPATNGAAERLVQTFKQALRKSSLPVKHALQEFLMQYRRTPLASGYSPSELLNGRQIRATIDTLFPSPAHQVQKKLNDEQRRMGQRPPSNERSHQYYVGQPCYALYYGPKREKQPRWVLAVITKVYGTRSVNVRVCPKGPTWRRHVEQLRPRFTSDEDNEPGDFYDSTGISTFPHGELKETLKTKSPTSDSVVEPPASREIPTIESPVPNPTVETPVSPMQSEYGPHNPRRSALPKPPRKKMTTSPRKVDFKLLERCCGIFYT